MIFSDSRTDQVVCWLLFILVYLSPLPFGAVEPWSTGILEALLLMLFSLFLAQCLILKKPLTFPLAGTALLFFLLHLVQLVPLPGQLLQWISPTSHYLLQVLRSGDARNLAQTISVDPDATMASLLWVSACLAAFYLVMNIAEDRQANGGTVHILPRAFRRLFRIPSFTRAEETALLLALTLSAAGAFQAGYGLLERAMGWNRIFFYVRRYPMKGVAGTFINTNHCAAFLALCLPLAISLILLLGIKDRRSTDRRLNELLALKYLLAVIAAMMALALILTRSGGGVISSLTGMSFLVFGYLMGQSGVNWRRYVMPALILLAATVTAIVLFSPAPHTFAGSVSTITGDLANRAGIGLQSLTICRDFPLFGSGAGTYNQMMIHYHERVVGHAHNEYLELLCDLGPAGLFCSLALLLFFFRNTWFTLFARPRNPRPSRNGGYPPRLILPLGFMSSMLGLATHCLVDFPLRIPAIALCCACALGLLAQLFRQGSGSRTN